MVTFSSPLLKGRLVKRYKRFLADVELDDGTIVVAHCVNTGSMKTCADAGSTVLLSTHNKPTRKLKYTWELTEVAEGYIGVNTALPNAVVESGIRNGQVAELTGYKTIRREVRYGERSRIDLLLESPGQLPCYVEVKNVTLLAEDVLRFPDARSERAEKHVREMVELHATTGARIVLFFLANRPEGGCVGLAETIDPRYAAALRQGVSNGLEVISYRTQASAQGIALTKAVPVRLNC